MTDDEFDAFLARAREQLEEKQVELEGRHGFGGGGRWWFEQVSQRLQIFDANDQLSVEADVIDIGSYASASSSWMWGWANPSLLPELQARALRLKELAATTGLALFENEHSFKIEDEAMAWDLAAMSVMHLGALGCYRAPSSSQPLASFLAIMTVQRQRM